MKPIPGFDGYFADESGNIYSMRPLKRFCKPPTHPRMKAQQKDRKGYSRVSFRKDKKLFNKQVHRLVLETFVGPCPEGMECCHNDGNKANNNIENLRWDTRKANHADKWKHGTEQIGEKHGFHKLTTLQVLKIRHLSLLGTNYIEIAKMFHVTPTNVGYIVRRQAWKHI